MAATIELPQGTLDLSILQTLTLAPQPARSEIEGRSPNASSKYPATRCGSSRDGSIPRCIGWSVVDGSAPAGEFRKTTGARNIMS